uniref:Peptidoglycan recognition protein 6 n=2 Tax=Nothobranchius furzeri TaxID=105023 RepID=A0A8C6MB54_NOTFU
MDGGFWKGTLVLLVCTYTAEASLSLHMDDFIKAVKRVEAQDPGSKPVAVLKRLRRAAGLNDAFIQHFLSDAATSGPELEANLSAYVHKAVHHSVQEDAREEGVVLTSDGTTVALRPLLLGLEAGFLSKTRGQARGLYHLTLAKDLGLSLRRRSNRQHFDADGCWDNLTSPRVFTLSAKPSLLTTALVNGGMDGVVLGMEVSGKARQHLKLSSLLTEYYNHQLNSEGLDSAPRLISRRRRENFKGLTLPPALARWVVKSVELEQQLGGNPSGETKKQLRALVRNRLKAFFHTVTGCPPIIPRCMWGAEPYRGTPTRLTLPLSFMYIHHTHSPSEPCLTFQQCSADMRSMQRFHQEDRGWDDIGYSFVAGSDGYIYEGRGWHWQGAHTLGHNSKGYGVSFIGDYTARLPSQHAMRLVRDQLAACAVGGGRLASSFTVQGHRQVVSTSCPGDTFYEEIRGWERFGVCRNTGIPAGIVEKK